MSLMWQFVADLRVSRTNRHEAAADKTASAVISSCGEQLDFNSIRECGTITLDNRGLASTRQGFSELLCLQAEHYIILTTDSVN